MRSLWEMIENRSQSLYCLYFLFSRRVVSTFSRYLTRGRECVAEAPTGAAQNPFNWAQNLAWRKKLEVDEVERMADQAL